METSDEEFVSEEEADSSRDDVDEIEESGPAAIKKLRERLKKAVEEKQEYLEGWQRARADFANYKREEASIHTDKEERMKANLIEDLIPALDVLELSLKHEDSPTLRMIEKQFLDALKRFGVERFGQKGEEFDPKIHEALAKHSEEHIVTSIERSGYAIDSPGQSERHIIRPAQVII